MLKDIEGDIVLMEKLAAALTGDDVGEVLEHDQGIGRRPSGAGLRAFHDLLESLAGNRQWGGLQRVLDNASGDHLWLCPEHYVEYELPLPDLSESYLKPIR